MSEHHSSGSACTPLIDVQNVSVHYPGAQEGLVLDGVGFSVNAGERVALIGANGAGKSTLLLTLVGILPIHDGAVFLNGVRLEKATLPAIRRTAGLIFQNPDDQLFMSTVWEDILFGPRNYEEDARRQGTASGPPDTEAREHAAQETLDQLGIAALKDKMPHKLSGGEKRMAALASVLVMHPAVLLMDEPSAFLDPRARRRLIALLHTLPQTLIVATHDLDLAHDLCPRSIILCHGRVHADGPTEAVLADAALLDAAGL